MLTQITDADKAFEAIVGSLDGPMVVVTSAVESERAGCLVGFHAQSSIEPRRMTVWLSKANHTYRVALRSTHFAVHFLATEQFAIARHFGTRSGDDGDKFLAWSTSSGPGDVPLLDDVPNWLVLRRVALLDEGGDHACVVGEVVDARSTHFTPMRLSQVAHLRAGHDADERHNPPTERAAD